MKESLIGILMATYNGEKFIKEQIDSILNQTYKNWKLIIHDDGSTDGTPKIIKDYVKRFPDKIIFIEDGIKCGGAKENFSHLIQIVKKDSNFDYIMFSDQDDIWLPDKIEISLKKIKDLEKIHGKTKPLLVYSDLKVVDQDLNVICESFWKFQKINPSYNSFNYLLVQNVVTGCTILINTPALKLISPIPKNAIIHDWWIALVVSAFGKLDFIKNAAVLYRQHGYNVTGAKKWDIVNVMKFIYNFAEVKKFKLRVTQSIIQAKTFLEIYNEHLDNNKRKIIEAFINLSNVNRLIRLYYIFKYKFLKSNFLRNLGTIILFLSM